MLQPTSSTGCYGLMIIMGLFLLGYISARTGLGLNPLGYLIGVPANLLIRFVLAITGVQA
jgi:hypothetical protein